MSIVIGIDNGTQSTKILCYDFEKKEVVARAQSPHLLHSDSDGTNEQLAQWWIEALCVCFSQIPNNIKQRAQAISVSGQQHGFVPVDKTGNVLSSVKLWCDTSTTNECQEIEDNYQKMHTHSLDQDLGNPILVGYTASKILHFKKNFPHLYQKIHAILLPHDYINYWLTGHIFSENGDASGSGIFNVHSHSWDKKALHAIDPTGFLDDKLPPLQNAGTFCAAVQDDIANRLGLPKGIPVATGGGDNMMSAIGTGCVENGILVMSMGTSGTLFSHSEKAIQNTNSSIANFCSSSGGHLPLLCTMNCTVATEQIRALLSLSVNEINEAATKADVGSGGLIFLPFFNGERSPNLPHASAELKGINGKNLNTENLSRATFESAVLSLRFAFDDFKKNGFNPKQIRLIGGGAKSKLWRSMVANIFNLEVLLPEECESAAFGSALQALWSLQEKKRSLIDICNEHVRIDQTATHLPDKEDVVTYENVFAKYKHYVQEMINQFTV